MIRVRRPFRTRVSLVSGPGDCIHWYLHVRHEVASLAVRLATKTSLDVLPSVSYRSVRHW
jgi:hypothetical protein